MHGLSCPAACGILVPRPGIEPMSPALEGRFLTTGPPGKSLQIPSYWAKLGLQHMNLRDWGKKDKHSVHSSENKRKIRNIILEAGSSTIWKGVTRGQESSTFPQCSMAFDLTNILWLSTEVEEELRRKCKQQVKTFGFWIMPLPPWWNSSRR